MAPIHPSIGDGGIFQLSQLFSAAASSAIFTTASGRRHWSALSYSWRETNPFSQRIWHSVLHFPGRSSTDDLRSRSDSPPVERRLKGPMVDLEETGALLPRPIATRKERRDLTAHLDLMETTLKASTLRWP